MRRKLNLGDLMLTAATSGLFTLLVAYGLYLYARFEWMW